MHVLVTGAAGKLGSLTVRALVRAGHEVRATDQRFSAELGVPFRPADLLNEHVLYELLEGVDALVHFGNHPNRFAGPSPQRLFAENVAMNANAFAAAADLGVRHIVFSSSIQVMITSDRVRHAPPHTLPYLPLDAAVPAAPGLNPYALSKHFAEETLRLLAAERPELSVTVIRYPMLVGEWFERRFTAVGGRVGIDLLHLGEATAHLSFDDGAALVVPALERARPGYRQVFPAQSIDIGNLPPPELVRRFYPGVPLRRPVEALDSLIDRTDLVRELGFEPRPGPRVTLVES